MTTRKINQQWTRAEAAVAVGARVDPETRELAISFSSETPVQRWYGDEILSHDKGAARLERINDGGVALFNHDRGDVIGAIVPGSVAIDAKSKRGSARIRFAKTARGDEIMGMVDDDILRNVSFMYAIHKIEENTKTSEYRVTDWEPFEISIVTIPADNSVGVGRAAEGTGVEVEITTRREDSAELSAAQTAAATAAAQPAIPAEIRGVVNMPGEKTAEQIAAEAQQQQQQQQRGAPQDPVALEGARVRAIENMAKAAGIDGKQVANWVRSGASPETVAEQMLTIMEERGKHKENSPAFLGMEKKEVEQWSLFRAVNALVSGNWSKAGLEREASLHVMNKTGRAAESGDKGLLVPLDVLKRSISQDALLQLLQLTGRDLTAGNPSGGGYLVDTSNQGFVDLLRNASVCMSMGARRLGGLQGNVTIPKRTAGNTGYWLGTEGTTVTESNSVFGQIAMTPKTAGAYQELSRLLMLQSSPQAEDLIMAGLAADVGTVVDLKAITGSGTVGEPLGLLNVPGIGSVAGAAFSYEKLIELQTDVATANALSGAASAGFATTPETAGLLKTLVKFAGTASPMWNGKLDRTNDVDGYAGMSSNQIPASTLIFGDWAQMIMAEWGVLEIAVNPNANFQAAIIGIRALYSMDVAVRYAGAFSVATAVAKT